VNNVALAHIPRTL